MLGLMLLIRGLFEGGGGRLGPMDAAIPEIGAAILAAVAAVASVPPASRMVVRIK
jgi:hypothetical protein